MKNNKRKSSIYVYLILFIIFIFLLIFIYGFIKDKEKKTIKEDNEEIREINEDVVVEAVKPFDEETSIKVNINNTEYELKLENNISAYDLASLAPLELNMEDLNNNEKYSYLSFSINNLDDYTGKISKGDVMLYQSNCIVIFYKDYETTNKYTKIGHIDNLPELNNETVKVLFIK